MPSYQVQSSWKALFFYVKKGYLPSDLDARDELLKLFLKPWLKDSNYRIDSPEEVFGANCETFVKSCGGFVLKADLLARQVQPSGIHKYQEVGEEEKGVGCLER